MSILCWVFQSMNTAWLSIYLDLCFLSLQFRSFQYTSPVYVLLELHQSISLFLKFVYGTIFNILLSLIIASILKYNWVLYVYLVTLMNSLILRIFFFGLLFFCFSVLTIILTLLTKFYFFLPDLYAFSSFLLPFCNSWNF